MELQFKLTGILVIISQEDNPYFGIGSRPASGSTAKGVKLMSRVVSWLQSSEQRMFSFINQRIQHNLLDRILGTITHLGGATLTISLSILLWYFGSTGWSITGLECLVALTISHIPVAIIKRKYPRLRPYLVFPETNTCKNPLTDHSFPSGHTTAIFSVMVPLISFMPILSIFLLPLAFIVGVSRVYLGLHYPSDVIAGAFIGTIAAIFSVAFIG